MALWVDKNVRVVTIVIAVAAVDVFIIINNQ